MRAIMITNQDEYRAALTEVDEQVAEGDVTVAVEYSTLNYKDSLAITGSSPVVRSFPMVPGIDLAGTVVESPSPTWSEGSRVILNGWGVGETHWGGFAERAAVRSEWLIPMPDGIDARRAMAIGTAGYTAMLCVMALERHGVTPDRGEVLVTGAAGGVGSVAVALLARAGYTVVASTGRLGEADYLVGLGASEVIDRAQFEEKGRPLTKERWAGAIDVAGGNTLANVCASTRYGGTVAACGLAQSIEFPATVAPFILRGVTLAGVDSVYCPTPLRIEAWKRLADELDAAVFESMATEVALGDVIDLAPQQLAGSVRGRVVVDVRR